MSEGERTHGKVKVFLIHLIFFALFNGVFLSITNTTHKKHFGRINEKSELILHIR